MDIHSYISSGIIEACLTGIASDKEVRQMELLSEKYPEIQAEIKKVQTLLEDLATQNAIRPSEGLKERIWENIHQKNEDTKSKGKIIEFSEKTSSATIEKQSINMNKWKYFTGAAVLLLIVSSFLGYFFYQKKQATLNEITSLQKQLLNSREVYNKNVALYQQKLKSIVAGNMQRIALNGVGKHSKLNALLFWNKTTKEVYLSLNQLPPPPEGKQYQLWAIVDGKPVSAGVYNNKDTSSVIQKMSQVSSKTQMFAVTLEKAGGVKSPTLSAMYVAGKI